MIIIERYLRDLQQIDRCLEERVVPAPKDDPDRERLDQTPERAKPVSRVARGAFLNAPMLAWELINDRRFPGWRSGYKADTKKRPWKGFIVDRNLKDKWLEDLNNIPNIELRSTCEGHGPPGKMGDSPTSMDWPTHIAFRLTSKAKNNPGQIVKNLNKYKHTKCKHGVGGREGRTRFICAARLYYKCAKHNDWMDWWTHLASRIDKAVNK